MNKNSFSVKFVIWMLSLLALFCWYLSPHVKGQTYSENENRSLADIPPFDLEVLLSGDFSDQVEDWLTDRFPVREKMISLYNRILDTLSLATYEDQLEIGGAVDPDAIAASDEDKLADLAAVFAHTPEKESAATVPAKQIKAEVTSSPVKPGVSPIAKEIQITPSPSASPKEPPNPADYPGNYRLYVKNGESASSYCIYDKNAVLAVTAVINEVAEALPDDGLLVYTVVPDGIVGNRYCVAAESARAAVAEGKADAMEKIDFVSEAETLVSAFAADNVRVVNAASVLKAEINKGAYCYYRTDYHWTPYGAYPVYCEMIRQAGFEPAQWKDFDLYTEENFLGSRYRDNPSAELRNKPDTLTVVIPKFSVEFRKITSPESYEIVPMQAYQFNANDRYGVNLGGPGGPWKYAVCDNGIERKCLVITDSYGLTAIPMFCYNYGEVHYYDARHFNKSQTGGSIREMIEKFGITDIYFLVGTPDSYSSGYITERVHNHLG